MVGIRKGAWSSQEDSVLINYIAIHGEGHWNHLALNSGLKRTGKSCRLRWKNYLRPNVRRGNFTSEEQLCIMQLHCLYGNRWSKIAEELPGRTDNEIKNYWRTRVKRLAKKLKCDINSREFNEFIRDVLLPRISREIHASDFDAVETTMREPIQRDQYWASFSTEAVGNPQVLATEPGSDLGHCFDVFEYGELSEMLLGDDCFWSCP